MAVLLSQKVKAELEDIWSFIAAESGSLEIADRVLEVITDTFVQLSEYPRLGRAREDLRPGLRSLAAGSYVVVYRMQGNDVRILHVVHGRRDIRAVVRH